MTLVKQLLAQADDIVLLGKRSSENKYRFAFPFKGDFARECYDATLKLDNACPEFQNYWKFNEQTGQINGSSTFLLTRLDRVLGERELELPDTRDLLELNKQNKLGKGKYFDSGIAVYNENEPNKETAKTLIEKAKQGKLELPLLWGFKDLDYVVSDNKTKIIPVAQLKRVISGKQAEEILNKFYREDSGACRVGCNRDGNLIASWDDFADSYSNGLVEWLVAESDAKILAESYDNLLTRKYDEKRDAEKRAFLENLKA